MRSENWETLRERASAVASDVLSAAGASSAANVEWFRPGADLASAGPYRVDQASNAVGLNRDIVEGWIRGLPNRKTDERFIALASRAAAALLFAPPAILWELAAEMRIRSDEDHGLDESFARAFTAANQILENHRLDQRVLDVTPAAEIPLAELVRFDLEAHPAFDIYPRATIIMGRPNLPSALVQPAFDEFVEQFGVDEADELTSILNDYVSLAPDAVDDMVDATAKLVFQAFPEAMGLGWGDDDEDLGSKDLLPFQEKLPDKVAAEVIWILRDLAALPSAGGLTLWGRGPAEIAARELGWELVDTDCIGSTCRGSPAPTAWPDRPDPPVELYANHRLNPMTETILNKLSRPGPNQEVGP